MRKFTSRITAVFLAMVFAVSILSPTVLAKNNTKSENHAYTFLGDSIASGYALMWDTPWSSELTPDTNRGGWVYWKRPMGLHQVVPDSYPAIVAEALGITTDNQINEYYNNVARCGIRTTELRRFLDPEYNAEMAKDTDDEGNRLILNEDGYAGMTKSELYEIVNETQSMIKKSKLVTLNIGSNDLTHAVTDDGPYKLQQILAKEKKTISTYALEEAAKEILSEGGDWTEILVKAISWAETVDTLPETLYAYTSSLLEAVETYNENIKEIVKLIYELNPDVTLVMVGFYNPFKDIQLTDLDLIKLGELGDTVTDSLNQKLKNLTPYALGSEYDYRYVDVSDVTLNGFSKNLLKYLTDGSIKDFAADFKAQSHPGKAGHQYIADQILEALGSDFTLDIPEDTVVTPDDVPEGYYGITTSSTEGGSLVAVPNVAQPGDVITVQAVPQSGYAIKSVQYYGEDGVQNTISVGSDGIGTFTMPASKVTVSAVFTQTDSDPTSRYVDVSTSDWYYEATKYVVQKGYMAGTSDNTFSPNDPLTRAMVVQILYAIKSKPPVENATQFADISGGEWYADAVGWASSRGVVAGYEDGTFRPNQYVTREELATMLRQFAAYSNADTEPNGNISTYADASSVSYWATEPMQWAVGHTIMAGKPNNMLDPRGTATRAEMAQMTYRLMTTVVSNTY